MSLEKVQSAIEEIRAGRMVILVDDEDRENEGDLVWPPRRSRPRPSTSWPSTAGLICLSLTDERIQALQLPLMVAHGRRHLGTAFTVCIEARHGVTTGISAADRAATIRSAVAASAKPEDLVRPGHVFPWRAPLAVCSCAPARPRARSTWRASPGARPPASSAKS